ncbi:oligosaccharide flippase family protein, partial [Escherichia coli]|uniref:oligosaccharide flippase family protein n=1 Tax=Escherichia coli TaxID=562 RepID=UPI0013B45698
ITSLYTTSGIVMLGAVSSNQEVGYYTSAQKLIDVTKSIMLMPISQVIFPILSEKFGKNRMDGIKAVQSIMPAFFLFSLIVLIFMISFGGIVLEVIFGGNFSPASPMLTILSFGLFAVFYGVLVGGQVMLNLGMDKEFLNVQVIVSVA